jgi:tetratricopeptide (TPR) repeat protein
MKRVVRWILSSVLGSILLTLVPACRTKPMDINVPVGPPVPEEWIQELVARGDESFQAMHLYAWRRAEAVYAKAFSLDARPEIREKLVLTRLLRITREIDEDIACPAMAEDIRFICADPASARGQALCDLAKAYAAGPVASAREMKRVAPSVLNTEISPLDAYFFLLHARTFGGEARDDSFRKQLSDKYQDTPLFMYLNFSSSATALSRALQKFPDFAEGYEFSAEMSFQRNVIKAARANFSRALELIPDYSRARIGLANIYFFTLEDYPNALKNYELTLKGDPKNTAALFGKGACLHHLGEYTDSNAALDQMLASDLSRRGRVGADSVRYYRGTAHYYKAYNHHLMKEPQRARELIDIAKLDLPQAEEINYLSGLLYYNAGNLDTAKADFERAVKSGKSCYGYHYLGLIELKRGGPTAASQFLTSTACLERGLRGLQENLRAASALDIDPGEKEALRVRMRMKLTVYRDSSINLILNMIALIRDSAIEINWKQIYMESMNSLLAKVQAIRT